jgi:Zn-dependent peptidase ImmA (M78 family)
MPTARKVEREVDALLREFGVSAPPVPVEDIARKLCVRLAFEQFGPDVSGILFREDGGAVIAINAGHPKTRQRFTIAHEIGHLRLHRGRPMFVDRSVRIDRRDANAALGIDPEEIEANGFAAALLMPDQMIVTALAQSALPRSTSGAGQLIARLARRFDVSPQAMEYRLANLGLIVPPQ